MTLRIQLLLLALITLALPWAGCQYAKQMEGVLRSGQENSLKTTASTLAQVVAADHVFVAPSDAPEYYALALNALPHLDGFDDEWPAPIGKLPSDEQRDQLANRKLRLGMYRGALHVFLSVRTKHVDYDSPVHQSNDDPIDRPSATRIVLLMAPFETPSNTSVSESGVADQKTPDQSAIVDNTQSNTHPPLAWSISALAPGPLLVHRAAVNAPWTSAAELENEIRGVWRASTEGYDVEFRVPQKYVGARMALVVEDRDTTSIATSNDTLLSPLTQQSSALHDQLERYAPAGTRLTVLDAQGWLLARAGSVEESNVDVNDASGYRMFLRRSESDPPAYGLPYGMWGEPIDSARHGESAAIWFRHVAEEPSIVRAAVPIMQDKRIVGVIAVEQAGERLLQQRDQALEHLINLGLLVTLLVVAAVLAFYTRLTWRIRRLSKAAAHALRPDGTIEHRLPDVDTRDELGDLARSYATLLQRFKEYAQYLQTLGSKLTHEMRTPLTIVASSLENLVAEPKANAAQPYIERARDGTKRLQTILTAMSEATRVEQSIEQTERVSFDLAAVLRGMTAAYQQTFSAHNIIAKLPETECPLLGAPDLIAQLLDKLLDNAADYCPSGGTIEITLEHTAKAYRLVVSNQGPLLAPEISDKLFDAMVGNRAGDAKKPHLGLGLFIVQLIARFHRGVARAFNLPDGSGVAFEIELPIDVK